MALLQLSNVRKAFGGLVAVNDLSFELDPGSIVAMIGPNGAGKSTVFNLVTGIYGLSSGSIVFDGRQLAGLSTSRIAALGVARTFQNIRLFAFMSALDNVMTGEHARMRANVLDSLLHTPAQRAEERRVRERAFELLRFVNLEHAAEQYARRAIWWSLSAASATSA
jgi:branched-chain amino acid transport system ATP-binding protein